MPKKKLSILQCMLLRTGKAQGKRSGYSGHEPWGSFSLQYGNLRSISVE